MLKRGFPDLIHQQIDDYGKIRVYEDHQERYLLFDTDAKQGGILRSNPRFSTLKYQHVMQSVAFLGLDIKNILLIGLGGGSMANFFQVIFPNSKVKVVELRAGVCEVAKKYFFLQNLPPLSLEIKDIVEYFSNNGEERFDVIILDAFMNEGMPSKINHPSFFNTCKEKLSHQGILVMNYWNSQYKENSHNLTIAKYIFDQRIMIAPVSGCSNMICFLFKNITPPNSLLGNIDSNIEKANDYYKIPYQQYLQKIIDKKKEG